MKFLSSEKLSQHKYKTPEGYLVCVDAILARTGTQEYRKNEVFADSDDDGIIKVDRKPEEVFSPATLASFENKPITVEHPNENVNTGNYKDYSVGFVRDVHRGNADGQEVMLGTLVITDEQTIEEIENGEHVELSCGYDCDIIDEENPQQRNIRGNHVALCEQGRAGIARIVDSNTIDDYQPKEVSKERIEALPLQARKIVREANDKKAAYISIKGNLEDIINAAEPSLREELKIKRDKILKDLRIGFNIEDSINDSKFGITTLNKWKKGNKRPESVWNSEDEAEAQRGRLQSDNYTTYVIFNIETGKLTSNNIIGDSDDYFKKLNGLISEAQDEEHALKLLREGRKHLSENEYKIVKEHVEKMLHRSINDVEPREGEDKADFISRFMEETKEEYPDAKQRLAVAYSYWEKRNMKDDINTTVAKIKKSVEAKDGQQYKISYRNTYSGESDKELIEGKNAIEAIKKFAKNIITQGKGTANINIISVSPNDGYMKLYGKLNELLTSREFNDSMKKFEIHYKSKGKDCIKIVKANSIEDAIKNHLKGDK